MVLAVSEGLTFALALLGAVTGSVTAAAEAISAVRDRQRLIVGMGTISDEAHPIPLPWVEVFNDSPRATTVREVGLYATDAEIETDRGAVFTGKLQFKGSDGPFFLEAGDSRRFSVLPDFVGLGLHLDFPVRAYAVDARGRRTWGGAAPVGRLMFGDDEELWLLFAAGDFEDGIDDNDDEQDEGDEDDGPDGSRHSEIQDAADVEGDDYDYDEDDARALKLFRPPEAPLFPAKVEAWWKLWKARDLRRPQTWRIPGGT